MLIIYYFQWIHNHNFWRIDYFFDFVKPNKKNIRIPQENPWNTDVFMAF